MKRTSHTHAILEILRRERRMAGVVAHTMSDKSREERASVELVGRGEPCTADAGDQ